MPPRPSYYEVINFKGKKLVASPTREFVYLILFNIPNVENHKPFYVGSANNLAKRLSNHAQVNWHYSKFDSPAQIFILGTVEKKKANEACEDLTEKLDNKNFHLNNKFSNRKTVDAEIMDTETIIEYVSTPTADDATVIIEWAEKWGIKTAISVVLDTNHENNSPHDITREEIHAYVNSIDMVGSMRSLANRIIENYDTSKGYSTYIFQKEDKPLINRMNHIWVPAQQKYHVPVIVKLAKRTAQTIIDSRL